MIPVEEIDRLEPFQARSIIEELRKGRCRPIMCLFLLSAAITGSPLLRMT